MKRNGPTYELFVGDLSFFCTEQDLHQLFHGFGSVLDIRIKKSDTKGRSLMFGFVKMDTPELARTACEALNGKLFMGRVMKVQLSQGTKSPTDNGEHMGHQIHVGFSSPLPPQASVRPDEAFLRRHFEVFGEIQDVVIKDYTVHQDGSGQEGYGFLTFFTEEAAQNAVAQLSSATLDGFEIESTLSHRNKLTVESQREGVSLGSSSRNGDTVSQHSLTLSQTHAHGLPHVHAHSQRRRRSPPSVAHTASSAGSVYSAESRSTSGREHSPFVSHPHAHTHAHPHSPTPPLMNAPFQQQQMFPHAHTQAHIQAHAQHMSQHPDMYVSNGYGAMPSLNNTQPQTHPHGQVPYAPHMSLQHNGLPSDAMQYVSGYSPSAHMHTHAHQQGYPPQSGNVMMSNGHIAATQISMPMPVSPDGLPMYFPQRGSPPAASYSNGNPHAHAHTQAQAHAQAQQMLHANMMWPSPVPVPVTYETLSLQQQQQQQVAAMSAQGLLPLNPHAHTHGVTGPVPVGAGVPVGPYGIALPPHMPMPVQMPMHGGVSSQNELAWMMYQQQQQQQQQQQLQQLPHGAQGNRANNNHMHSGGNHAHHINNNNNAYNNSNGNGHYASRRPQSRNFDGNHQHHHHNNNGNGHHYHNNNNNNNNSHHQSNYYKGNSNYNHNNSQQQQTYTHQQIEQEQALAHTPQEQEMLQEQTQTYSAPEIAN